jgi:putative zinc finger protein
VSAMTCDRAAELLSDDLDGTLDGVIAAELSTHLLSCAECRALRATVADVRALLRAPEIAPAADLAARVAAASWTDARPRVVPGRSRARDWAVSAAAWLGWLADVPFAVQAVSAGFALVLTAGLVMAAGSAPGAPVRPRWQQRVSETAVYLVEKKDRVVEDVRLLRVVIATAFEGRLDRVNDRVDDYRRLLERRQKDEQAKDNKKSEAIVGVSRWAGDVETAAADGRI